MRNEELGISIADQSCAQAPSEATLRHNKPARIICSPFSELVKIQNCRGLAQFRFHRNATARYFSPVELLKNIAQCHPKIIWHQGYGNHGIAPLHISKSGAKLHHITNCSVKCPSQPVTYIQHPSTLTTCP